MTDPLPMPRPARDRAVGATVGAIKLTIMVYVAAIATANLLVAFFGPWSSPILAFLLIGGDLALRDWLHVHLSARKMFMLVLVSGGLTYFVNPAAGVIAIASSVAFTTAAMVDFAVFAALSGSWMRRANISNFAGAAVDSVIFPVLAFGSLMPGVIVLQFIAKITGGALWAWALRRRMAI